MLTAWHQFKICLIKSDAEETSWILVGQRHDGAVFWNSLCVREIGTGEGFREAFWRQVELILLRFENRFATEEAPRSAYVPFSAVGYWFQDEEGNRYFK